VFSNFHLSGGPILEEIFMKKSWLLCVLLGTLAWGQAAPATPSPQPAQAPANEAKPATPAMPQARPAPPPDTSASVPDNAPVITVDGVCPPQPKPAAAKGATGTAGAKPAAKAAPAGECKTVITKAQFEKLAAAVAPTVTPQLKKQLAGVLPRYIALSAEAKKEGMDKSEQFKETMKFVQMQVLTNELQQKVQKEAANVPDADIEKYYQEHQDAYEQYNLDRLFIPRTKQAEPEAKNDEDKDEKLTDEQKKAKEDADKAKADQAAADMTKLADSLRARAAAGEDFAKLQKEAFEAAGMKVESPSVNLPSVRRTGLPQGHVAVFELKVGEVSDVISDAGGHYIYKVNSKTVMTLDQARNEIHGKLQNERMKDRMDKLNGSYKADNNEAYFGPGGVQPPQRGPGGMGRPRPGTPPGAPPQGASAAPAPSAPAASAPPTNPN
jgi:chemotaxis protein histidine kinase CheA